MDFKLKVPDKKELFKLATLALLGLVLIIMIVATISTSGENKRLKTSINENEQKIKKLETEKITIFESIEKKSELLERQKSIILNLKRREDSLINNLKTLKNERTIKQNAYSNNDVNKRVRIFSELVSGH